ncbi:MULTISPECIES: helix-turn-helix domain-containing protein [Gordonibacter]|uniref:Helix-turn-helix transcriptional regulator n=1 Tax=Gordonibacter faecis TaxID=3047475 RepID=A0ABT7DJY3_9ACTN|nr:MULTISPECIES: helix-turn-helix transcriptional regulator [unclassified Gordonibacter]MDJ1649840.1 helix-turn-helix transcriptional regulator [Gordonibacter sp. KGMB12511]HIW75504.1 helix-turn-helix domain-containing protein [Candidatus Gordonibacter avicola]
MSFAENLVYLRQHYGITQEGLAEQLGVSRQTVSKWEAGTNYPEMEKLLVLCDLFHVSMDDLLRGAVSVAKEGDTERYDRHMNRYDASIVAGVACILTGVGMTSIAEALHLPDNIQAVALLSFVVVGVVLLVMAGLNHSEFKRRNPAIEPRYDAETLERASRRFPLQIAAGVGLILLDVIMLVGLTPEDDTFMPFGIVVEDLLIAPFMLIMAVAVGLLIWAGMQKSKYDLSELTYIAHRSDLGADLPPNAVVKSPEQLRAEQLMGVACGIIMLLATIVFLVWGFVPLFDQMGGWAGMDKFEIKDAIRSGQGGFAISWIAFAVGGILCAVVCLVGSVLSKSKEDWIAEARQEDAWIKYAQSDTAQSDPWSRTPEEGDTTHGEQPRN